MRSTVCLFFFFNDTATTEIYTLSLHDALPICSRAPSWPRRCGPRCAPTGARTATSGDRKSTRLNSSHSQISYAVFCLKKKKQHAQGQSAVSPHVTAASPGHHLHAPVLRPHSAP